MPTLTLNLKLLGSFDATLGDLPLRMQTKAAALLSLLASPIGAKRSRAYLTGMLWPSVEQGVALHNLRQLLHHVRSDVHRDLRDFLSAERHTVQLRAGCVSTDVLEFERLVRSDTQEALERAAMLYRGEFLEGLALGCDEFEDWLQINRRTYEQLALATLQKLDAALPENGSQVYQVIGINQKILSIDPENEQAAGRIARLLRISDPEVTPSDHTTSSSRGRANDSHPRGKIGVNSKTIDGRERLVIAPIGIGSGALKQAEIAFRYWYVLREFLFKTGGAVVSDIGNSRESHQNGGPIFHSNNHFTVAVRGFSFRNRIWAEVSLISPDGPDVLRCVAEIEPVTLMADAKQMSTTVLNAMSKATLSRERGKKKILDGGYLEWNSDSKALRLLFSFRQKGINRAIERLEQLVDGRRNNASHWSWLSYAKLQRGWYGAVQERACSIEAAACDAETALCNDANSVLARIVLGRSLVLLGHSPQGRDELAAVWQQAPGSAQANFALAQALVYAGQFAAAVPLLRRAIALAPDYPNIWITEHVLAWALTELGQLDEAKLHAARAAGRQNSSYWSNLTLLGACSETMDRELLAAQIATLHKRAPGYDLAAARADMANYLHPEVCSSYLRRLEKAGLS